MALKGKQGAKRAKARAEKRARKTAAMKSPGFKSKYALRKEARARGEPMKGRGLENRPWHYLTAPVVVPPSPSGEVGASK